MGHQENVVERDADGLEVQKYQSVVLVVVPSEGFGEQVLRYARSSLYNVHVGTWSVSTRTEDMVKGRLQDEFLVDGSLAEARMETFSGILLAGSEGECLLARDAKVLEMVREAARSGKLIGAWGNAVEALASAGVVSGRKVTGSEQAAAALRRAGAKYSGREYEISDNIVTARDESAGMRFGKALADVVRI